MAQINPFRALRALPDQALHFSASAYDSEARHAEFESLEHCPGYLQVLLPQLSSREPISTEACMQLSRERLADFISKGILQREAEPALYVYRQIKGNATFTCIIGLASLDDYRDDKIKKHELTRTDKEAGITRYFREVGINGSPVLLTYPDIPRLSQLVSDVLVAPAPLYHFIAEDGIEHMLWKVNDAAQIAQIQQYFAALPALYIADGHHRCAAFSELYPQAKQFMACFIPDSHILIHSFHRYVTELGMPAEAFLEQLSHKFEVEKMGHRVPVTQPGVIFFYDGREWYGIKIPKNLKDVPNPRQALDIYILDRYIFGDILKIEDTRTSQQLQFINGETSQEMLLQPVLDKRVEALFMLHPIQPEEVMQVSDFGETMPPKSTWIEPKLRSGLLIHEIKN